MRGAAANFLGGIRRRDLLNFSQELQGVSGDFLGVQDRSGICSQGFAVGIVGVGFKTKTHRAAIALAATGIKTCEARGASERKNQDAGSERIERAEMADAAKAHDPPHGFDNVVRSFPGGFVDDNNSVEGRRLWWMRHLVSEFAQRQ